MKRNYWMLYRDELSDGGGDVGGGAAPAAEPSLDSLIDATVEKAAGELDLTAGDPPASDGSPPGKAGAAAPAEEKAPLAAPKEGGEPEGKASESAEADRFAAPPRSWKPELKDSYAALPPQIREQIHLREQQMAEGVSQIKQAADYGRQLKEVLAPYQPLLDAQGIKDHGLAVRYLMNAHYQLSSGDEAARAAAFAKLAASYKIDLAKAAQAAPDEKGYTDPALRQALDRVDRLEQHLTAEQSARLSQIRAEKTAEVEAFAADPKHSLFDEVADHIALLLQKPGMTLETAYEQAVWANPSTRAKQIEAERKTAEAAALERAKKEAAAAAKARGTRVRGADGRDTPDPAGSLDETLKETLSEIRSRA